LVVHKENGGLPSARNAGMERAEGKFYLFLDADDFMEDGFLTDDIFEELEKNYDLYAFSYKHLVDESYYKEFKVKTGLKTYEKDEIGKCDWRFSWSHIFNADFIKEKNLVWEDGTVPNEDMLWMEQYSYHIKSYRSIDKVINNYRKNSESILHTIKWSKIAQGKLYSYALLKEWYKARGEKYNLDVGTGMIFSEILDTVCGENTYIFCKNFIDTHSEFACVKNYKNIEIPPFYYPKVERFMEHTFAFWIKNKVKYKCLKMLTGLAKSFPKLNKLYEYVLYVKIRKYSVAED